MVSLDKLAGDPVDIYVNGRLIARGEVVVIDEEFGIRIAEIVVGADASVGENAVIYSGSVLEHGCRIGDHAMVAACSKCVQDVPPFVIADGNPCETKMINAVGLKRSGFTDEEIATAKLMHRLFYRDGLNTTQAIEKARALPEASSRVVKAFVDFAASTKRGLA